MQPSGFTDNIHKSSTLSLTEDSRMSSDSNNKIKTIAQNQLTEVLTMSATPATTSSTIR